jgi:hypothetical protein
VSYPFYTSHITLLRLDCLRIVCLRTDLDYLANTHFDLGHSLHIHTAGCRFRFRNVENEDLGSDLDFAGHSVYLRRHYHRW